MRKHCWYLHLATIPISHPFHQRCFQICSYTLVGFIDKMSTKCWNILGLLLISQKMLWHNNKHWRIHICRPYQRGWPKERNQHFSLKMHVWILSDKRSIYTTRKDAFMRAFTKDFNVIIGNWEWTDTWYFYGNKVIIQKCVPNIITFLDLGIKKRFN